MKFSHELSLLCGRGRRAISCFMAAPKNGDRGMLAGLRIGDRRSGEVLVKFSGNRSAKNSSR